MGNYSDINKYKQAINLFYQYQMHTNYKQDDKLINFKTSDLMSVNNSGYQKSHLCKK